MRSSWRVGWALLLAWVSLLGLQVIEVQRFRVAPSDAVLAVLAALLLIRERAAVVSVLRKWTPVHTLLATLLFALAFGSVVALVRTGVLIRDAWLNKDAGWIALALIPLCVMILVRSVRDVRVVLQVFLLGGAGITWLAVAWTVVIALSSGLARDFRFPGLLFNPSAEAVFVSALILVQVASSLSQGIVAWPHRVQQLHAIALLAVLLATLSRSSWIATIAALAVVGVMNFRRSMFPLALALTLALVTAAPLAAALRPIATQVASGVGPETLRDRPPVATAPHELEEFASALPTQPPTPNPTPIPSSTATPTPAATPTPSVNGAASALSGASAVAADEFGATDRLALDVIGLKLWLLDPSMALTGIGNGVFLQVSPYTALGASLIIHSTYVWLPVEMGVAGIGAVIALVLAAAWALRRLRRADFDLVMVFVGVGVLFAVWIGINEGLYQRTLWLMLALAVVTGDRSSKPNGGE